MEAVKFLLLKIFSKEKIVAYVAGAVIALGAAYTQVDKLAVEKEVCKDFKVDEVKK